MEFISPAYSGMVFTLACRDSNKHFEKVLKKVLLQASLGGKLFHSFASHVARPDESWSWQTHRASNLFAFDFVAHCPDGLEGRPHELDA